MITKTTSTVLSKDTLKLTGGVGTQYLPVTDYTNQKLVFITTRLDANESPTPAVTPFADYAITLTEDVNAAKFSINDGTNFVPTMQLIDTVNYAFKDLSSAKPKTWNWKISKQKADSTFADTLTYTSKNFSLQFKHCGIYKIQLSVNYTGKYKKRLSVNYGGTTNYVVSQTVNVTCPGTPKSGETCLEADFYAHKTTLTDGETATFEDLSLPGAVSWQWTFEGGTPATYSGQTPPPVAYRAESVFDVSLTVSDGRNTDTYTGADYISVNHVLSNEYLVPTAQFPTIQSAIDFVKINGQQNITVYGQPGTFFFTAKRIYKKFYFCM